MSARSHMNGWRCWKVKRVTRRERELPRLRGDGTPAMPRDIPPHYRCVKCGSILTVHRRIILDFFRQAKRLEAGRYCWNPVIKETSDGIPSGP